MRDGEYVPLAEQDPALWDAQMIDEAEALLRRASALGVDRPLPARGRAAVGARVSPPHGSRQLGRGGAALRRAVRARRLAGRRDQSRAGDRGAATAPAPRSTAMPEVAADARLAEYQPYWAARAELLARTGAHGEARHAYEIAIGLERDPAVRRFLQRRQAALSG